MAKQLTPSASDDLIADSLQIENYMNQVRNCNRDIVRLELEGWFNSYLKRCQSASPQLKFKIFLFSRCYAEKIELFLEELRGEQYV